MLNCTGRIGFGSVKVSCEGVHFIRVSSRTVFQLLRFFKLCVCARVQAGGALLLLLSSGIWCLRAEENELLQPGTSRGSASSTIRCAFWPRVSFFLLYGCCLSILECHGKIDSGRSIDRSILPVLLSSSCRGVCRALIFLLVPLNLLWTIFACFGVR